MNIKNDHSIQMDSTLMQITENMIAGAKMKLRMIKPEPLSLQKQTTQKEDNEWEKRARTLIRS